MKTIKRKLAMVMATILAVGSIPSLPVVWAKTTKETEIVSFQELPEEILYQEVEYGTKKRSLDLPRYLYAEVQEVDEDEDSEENESTVTATSSDASVENATPSDAESIDWKRIRVNWILNESFSEQDEYDGEVPGTYVFEAELDSDRYILSGAELPWIEVEVSEKEEEEEPFAWETEIDGIQITLTADPGVFPDGAEVQAEILEEDTDDFVNVQPAILKANGSIDKMWLFDIRVKDENGEEIQPNHSSGNAELTFTYEEDEDETYSLQLFGMESGKDSVKPLSKKNSENTVSAKVDRFSLYSLVKSQETEEAYIARIGDTKYKTVTDAVQSVKGNGKVTIVMIDNSEEYEPIVIDESKQIVLDLNGYTLTGPEDVIIIDGKKASVTLKDSSEEKTGAVDGNVSARNGGTLRMSGGAVG